MPQDILSAVDSLLLEAATLQSSDDDMLKRYAHRDERGDVIILADISTSMEDYVGDAETRWDAMKEALIASYDASNTRIIEFGSYARFINSPNVISRPRGSTDLAAALRIAIAEQPGQILVISDGEPNSKEAALDEAARFKGVINCIFIGNDGNVEAIKFLDELSKAAAGRIVVHAMNVMQQKTLSEAMRFALPARAGEGR